MSDQPGSNADREPQSKRQKRGDGGEEAFGGPMYDEATARKILKEAVLADEEFAEDGEPVIGFDPDDAALDNLYFVHDDRFIGEEVTPMIYFALKGDAKMCRYLVSRGASTTKSSKEHNMCPMYVAAYGGHLELCKVLQAHGANDDVRKKMDRGWTPFHIATQFGHVELVRWLVLQGALCADANSETVEVDGIFPKATDGLAHVRTMSRSCVRLVDWAEEVMQSHSALITFLGGALPPAHQDQSRTLQCLSGYPGVRKHICDYSGLEVTKGKQLRILRSVVDVLPSVIAL